MSERTENIRDLIVKHIRNELSVSEYDELQQWVDASGKNKLLFDELTSLPWLYQKLNDIDRYVREKDELWGRLEAKLASDTHAPLPFLGRRWVKYAAAAIVLLVAGYWMFGLRTAKDNQPEVTQQVTPKNDIEPGKYKAMLTLSDGRKVLLDSAVQGELAKQGNATVLNKDGQLIYDASTPSPEGEGEVRYNTLTTAKGQTYMTVLADGSKVWLNSGSSIRYPVTFTVANRMVEIMGEAYFEIARDKNKPFRVKAVDMVIEVTGTKFNVNAYSDEAMIKTTLLEGGVNILPPSPAVNKPVTKLTPGQQAQLSSDGLINIVKNVDTEEVLAWKNGKFYFNNTELETVMRQIARWYDVDIQYTFDAKKNPLQLVGRVSRNNNASQVLEMLEATGYLDFKIEGKRITVTTK